jgi:hypothetical protein
MENQNTGQKPPKSWLLESILVTIFCCPFIFGIIGIVNATKVESRFYAGDIAGANQASADAGKWTKIGFFVGLGLGLCYIIFWFLLGGAALMGALQNT